MKLSKYKIIASIIAILIVSFCLFFLTKPSILFSNGCVSMQVVDLDGSIIKEKKIDYKDGDTVVSLVENNFDNVFIENGMLMTIESLTTPNDWSYYICIYQNDEMSNTGIFDMKLSNNDVIKFILTANPY